MGCGKTQNQRKTRKDGMEELETKVARKSIQKRTPKRRTEGIAPHAFSTSKFRHLSSFTINGKT
jgi:hypothetical protein